MWSWPRPAPARHPPEVPDQGTAVAANLDAVRALDEDGATAVVDVAGICALSLAPAFFSAGPARVGVRSPLPLKSGEISCRASFGSGDRRGPLAALW